MHHVLDGQSFTQLNHQLLVLVHKVAVSDLLRLEHELTLDVYLDCRSIADELESQHHRQVLVLEIEDWNLVDPLIQIPLAVTLLIDSLLSRLIDNA